MGVTGMRDTVRRQRARVREKQRERERERGRERELIKTGQDHVKRTDEAPITTVNWRPSFGLSLL